MNDKTNGGGQTMNESDADIAKDSKVPEEVEEKDSEIESTDDDDEDDDDDESEDFEGSDDKD